MTSLEAEKKSKDRRIKSRALSQTPTFYSPSPWWRRSNTDPEDKHRIREEKAGEVVLAAAYGGDAGEPWRTVLSAILNAAAMAGIGERI
jgi:hypothetical protein